MMRRRTTQETEKSYNNLKFIGMQVCLSHLLERKFGVETS